MQGAGPGGCRAGAVVGMGSRADEADRDNDEAQHQVQLTRPYLMAQTEVTQAQYEAVIGENPAQYKGCGPDCPVEQVNWLDAVTYCNRLSEKEGCRRVTRSGARR